MSGRTLITGRGRLTDGLAAGLTTAGARVAVRDLDEVTRAAVASKVADAADELGGLDTVVHVQIVAAAPRTVVESSTAEWVGCSEDAMEAAIHLAQEAHGPLADGGGRLVFVLPTIGMSGAAGFAGSAAAADGIRALAKGLAKQWGHHGITVNVVAVGPEAVLGGEVGAELSAAVALAAPALGRPGDPEADIAPIIAALASPETAFVTGSTLNADGGVWMGA